MSIFFGYKIQIMNLIFANQWLASFNYYFLLLKLYFWKYVYFLNNFWSEKGDLAKTEKQSTVFCACRNCNYNYTVITIANITTAPESWKNRSKNFLKVIWKFICLIFGLFFLQILQLINLWRKMTKKLIVWIRQKNGEAKLKA